MTCALNSHLYVSPNKTQRKTVISPFMFQSGHIYLNDVQIKHVASLNPAFVCCNLLQSMIQNEFASATFSMIHSYRQILMNE